MLTFVQVPRVASLFLLCTLSPLACQVHQGPLVVRKVLVDVDPAAIAAGIDRERVRAIVDEMLHKARGVRVIDNAAGDGAVGDGAVGDGAVVRVVVESFAGGPAGSATARPGGADARADSATASTLSLALEVTGAQEGGIDGVNYRGHSVASAAGALAAAPLVSQALRDALGQVLSTRGASELKSPELVTWLTDPASSKDQLRRAIRILGSRRETAALPALHVLLNGADEELAQQALVAVTNVSDASSVKPVIAFAERQPPMVRKLAIDAVRAMGTREGKAWLFTLSTGHPDEDVQQQARAALVALEGEPSAPLAPVSAPLAERIAPARANDNAHATP